MFLQRGGEGRGGGTFTTVRSSASEGVREGHVHALAPPPGRLLLLFCCWTLHHSVERRRAGTLQSIQFVGSWFRDV